MKKDIHPKYEKTVIKCACGNAIETKSTVFPEMHVELCSACHPFFTGKQKFVDAAGRVDKFRARMEKAEASKKAKVSARGGLASDQKSEKPKEKPSNQDKLAEIKEELTGPKDTPPQEARNEAPGEVTQTETSDEELAAAEALNSSKPVPSKAEVADNKEN